MDDRVGDSRVRSIRPKELEKQISNVGAGSVF